MEEKDLKQENPEIEQENPAEPSFEAPAEESAEQQPQENAALSEAEEQPPQNPSSPSDAAKSLPELKEAVDKVPEPEEKLSRIIDFMEKSLAQKGAPRFKEFWEARSLCLELFKSQMPPAIRSILWDRYSELSKEARRLKQIFDEQSAFAMEQISEAIKAVEQDVDVIQEKLETVPEVVFESKTTTLKPQLSFYTSKQRELNLYNTLAARVTALRKELIKTDMRIRHKNQFFQRLSALGDRIFPQRKELIQQISRQFIDDVKAFANEAFSGEQLNQPHFAVRDEIKALQSSAKTLTLNTGSFNQSRKLLSDCWDKLRKLDKEFKKDRAEKKELFEQNAQPISQEIAECKEAFEAGKIGVSEAHQKMGELSRKMRNTELGRDEVKQLQSESAELRKLVKEKEGEEEKLRKEKREQQARQQQEALDVIRKEISSLEEKSDSEEPEQLDAMLSEIIRKVEAADLIHKEKNELLEALVPSQDVIAQRAEDKMLSAAGEGEEAKQKMRHVLELRRERRQMIKEQIESTRKILGGSGLDFEQSLYYNELLNRHKDRLSELNDSIETLEIKLR